MLRSGVCLAVGAFALALTLAGCTPVAPSARATGSSTRSASPSTAPPVTKAPVKPGLTDLVVSPGGLGAIRIGRSVPVTEPSIAIAKYDPAACVGDSPDGVTTIKAGDPAAAAWVANYPNVDEQYGGDAPFTLATVGESETGAVSAIAIWDPAIHTSTGIAIGSTTAEVKSAYPSSGPVVDGYESDVYVIAGSSGKLLIELAKPDMTYWSAAEAGRVLWMIVVTPDAVVTPIAGTDGAVHTCPGGD